MPQSNSGRLRRLRVARGLPEAPQRLKKRGAAPVARARILLHVHVVVRTVPEEAADEREAVSLGEGAPERPRRPGPSRRKFEPGTSTVTAAEGPGGRGRPKAEGGNRKVTPVGDRNFGRSGEAEGARPLGRDEKAQEPAVSWGRVHCARGPTERGGPRQGSQGNLRASGFRLSRWAAWNSLASSLM